MFDLEAETLLELPLEALAFIVLQDFASGGQRNRYNWLLAAKRQYGPGDHLRALAEAWAWLEARGLVAQDPDQTDSTSRFVTRAGRRALRLGSIIEVLAAERIGLDLHPKLEAKIRPIFLLGDYETAAFKAMKEVEVRVRELGNFPDDLIGVSLMRKAFSPVDGVLANQSHEGGERQARSDLFSGAIGSFKNPASHRPVSYDDPAEASEVVLLADLLMRILDSVESMKS